MPIHELIKKLAIDIYKFYRYDCCWPYSISFYLVLYLYWLESVVIQNPSKWASILSYGIIFLYYIYILKKHKVGAITEKRNLSFFISFLTTKIIVWGALLFRVAML